jgi:PAS domain S-box-containing protein
MAAAPGRQAPEIFLPPTQTQNLLWARSSRSAQDQVGKALMKNLLYSSTAEFPEAERLSGGKIMVVEDEWLLAQGLKENLQDLGYEVTGVADNAAAALKLAAEQPPDLVLMDIMLKGSLDGIETARQLRHDFQIPVVFLTAYTDAQTLGRAKLVEPYGYILKPFEVRELRSAIEIALYKHQAEKRLQHLNQVLRAIRSIGQLIIQEKNQERLIQQACQLLTEGRSYATAWIALLDGEGLITSVAAAGRDYSLNHASSLLQKGILPPCGLQAMEQPGLVVVEDLAASCADCFWWVEDEGRGALVTRLSYQNIDYGVVGVQLPSTLTRDEEEMILFRELAGDLSFALYKIDLESREQQARQAHLASEANYRRIVETANEGIWTVDREIHTMYVNQLLAQTLGYSREEMQGRPVTDFLFPEDLADFHERIERRNRGKYEQRLRRRDGSELWTIVSVRALKDEAGKFQGSFAMLTDITERKKAEEALIAAKDEWERTFDAVPDLIAILDKEQTILNLNQGMAARLGVTKEEVRGRKCYEVVHGLMGPPAFCPFILLLGNRQSHTAEVFEERLGAFLQVSVSPLFDQEEDLWGCVHVIRDITERKQAEGAQREQFLFLETLIDTIPNPIFYKDTRGKYLGCNRAFEKYLGVPRNNIVGKTAHDLAPQELADKYHQKDLELFQQPGEQAYEARVKFADGSLREVLFYKASFPKADGAIGGLVGVMLDITQRKQTEEALKKSQSQQQAILDNIPDLAWLKDTGGRYIAANEPFGQTCGVRPRDLVGKTDLDLWPRELAEKYRHDDREVMRTAKQRRLEEPIIDTTGRISQIETIKSPFYSDQGEIMGTCGIARDITQRKQTEEELRRAHQEIEQLFESIPFMMIGLSPDGSILQWNPEAEKVLWPESRPRAGERLEDYCSSWDWDKVRRGMAKCQETGLPTRSEDIRYQRPDGKDGFLGITFSPIRGEYDRIMGLILLGHDITERRLLEAQLAQAQKLESIGQLAAGIAHEINTPIQYVGDNTRFLKDAMGDLWGLMQEYGQALEAVAGGEEIGKVRQALAEAEAQADLTYLMTEIPKAIEQSLEGVDRVAKIVRAMKDFSHPGTGEKTAVNINLAIENTIMVARNEWKYVAELVTGLDPGLPLVSCLPDEFNQVLLNLIINAAHAIGEVVGGGGDKGKIAISTRQDGDWAEIRVQDSGTGIPEKIRPKIFDPFFTTKQVGKGTGQGLAIAHSVIVDKHGGTICCETEMGQGTTFIIRLPLESPAA